MQDIQIRTYSSNADLVRKRRDEIAKLATTLFLKKGYLKATTREIAKECRISIGTLYHYIGSKEDILDLINDAWASEMNSIAKQVSIKGTDLSAAEKTRMAIQEYMKYADEHQNDIVFWYQETKNLRKSSRKNLFDLERTLVRMFEKLLIEGCKRGEFKIPNTTLAANDLVVLCDMWAFRRWMLREKFTLKKYIRQQSEIILNSICRKKEKIF